MQFGGLGSDLFGFGMQLTTDDEVVINELDFPAGATPWLTCTSGPTVKLWTARDGQLIIDDLVQLISPRTGLVQLSLVSFYNGHRVDLDHIWKSSGNMQGRNLSLDVTQAWAVFPCRLAMWTL